MPLYDFECRACETRFERLVARAGADVPMCPSCASADVKRLLSVIAGVGGRAQEPARACGEGACGACS